MTEQEWKWDVNFKQGLMEQQGAFNTTGNPFFECSNATTVHSGLLYAFQQIRDQVRMIVEQNISSAGID
jgi:hypothetical protein